MIKTWVGLYVFIFLFLSFLFISSQTKTPVTTAKTDSNVKIETSVPQEETFTLITTGDIMLGRTINSRNVQANNFTYQFEKTRELLTSGDITFVNLEFPFVKNCPFKSDGLIFCADTRNIQGLTYSGIDIVNLANNHTTNFGKTGVDDTLETLDLAKILYTGISGPTYIDVKGIKVAFLGYNDIDVKNPYIAFVEENKIKTDILIAKRDSDLVIVAFHWGNEYTSKPSSRQIYFAHLAIDSGADLIIGNHPHWIQPVEVYKGRFIAYSHGNFIFDQYWSQKTREGIVIKWSISRNSVVGYEVIPIYIDNFGQAQILDGKEKQRILLELEQETLLLRETIKHFPN